MYYKLTWIDDLAGLSTEWFLSEAHAMQIVKERNLTSYNVRAVYWPFEVGEEKKNSEQYRTPDGEKFTGEKAFVLSWLNRWA
jgi:hypothetical protein